MIGRDGRLPWRLPSDLKRFRKLTLGKPMIMGRKTYDSIGKPLDGRDTIVVTRQSDFGPPGVHVASSVEDAIALGQELAARRGADEVMVIGGAEVFRRGASPAPTGSTLTLVHATPPGDTRFEPPIPDLARDSARTDAAGPQRPIPGRFHRLGPERLTLRRMAFGPSAPHITELRRFNCAHHGGAL